MALIINTNVASLIAQQNLSNSSSLLNISIQRLSSGLRINTAADDAAGLARADQLRSQSKMVGVAMRNANDGISAMEISDKTAEQVTNVLTRMSELAASAAQGTLDTTTRDYYKDEYDKLVSEIDRIAATTEFGGIKLLNGSVSSITMFIGFKSTADNQLSISLVRLDVAISSLVVTGGMADGLVLSTGILANVTGALSAIAQLSTALKLVNDARAVYGASSNRLSITLANLMVTSTNFMAA
ncbi:MAG: flagellin FliC, partial [Thermodesulfobacteriota bacterium]